MADRNNETKQDKETKQLAEIIRRACKGMWETTPAHHVADCCHWARERHYADGAHRPHPETGRVTCWVCHPPESVAARNRAGVAGRSIAA